MQHLPSFFMHYSSRFAYLFLYSVIYPVVFPFCVVSECGHFSFTLLLASQRSFFSSRSRFHIYLLSFFFA